VDTHRTWEALSAGAIPIVWNGSLRRLYDNLPVMIVNHHDDITEAAVEEKYEELHGGDLDRYHWNKIYAFWWLQQIEYDRRLHS